MLRKDIKAGVIYADRGPLGNQQPEPVLFLQDGGENAYRYLRGDGQPRLLGRGTRITGDHALGFPALVRAYRSSAADAVAALEAVNVKTELRRFEDGDPPGSEHLRFALYNRLAGTGGDYTGLLAAWQVQEAERSAREQEELQQRRDLDERLGKILAAFRAAGLGIRRESWHLVLSAHEAEAVLARLGSVPEDGSCG